MFNRLFGNIVFSGDLISNKSPGTQMWWGQGDIFNNNYCLRCWDNAKSSFCLKVRKTNTFIPIAKDFTEIMTLIRFTFNRRLFYVNNLVDGRILSPHLPVHKYFQNNLSVATATIRLRNFSGWTFGKPTPEFYFLRSNIFMTLPKLLVAILCYQAY